MLYRQEIDGFVCWSSLLNGQQAEFVTDDPTIVVTERGIVTPEIIGVELVDQDGERRAWSVRSN